ncbi:MAG: hypothetical protein Ta2B_05420 [Termitinemataceae bacterium]|nr:MAG: hypothetical protein Ta2B_05420 [Termitinemataceae bacterium]
MWMIWSMLIMIVPLLGLAAYAMWNDYKYDEYHKSKGLE